MATRIPIYAFILVTGLPILAANLKAWKGRKSDAEPAARPGLLIVSSDGIVLWIALAAVVIFFPHWL